jgi:hypothetical protein
LRRSVALALTLFAMLSLAASAQASQLIDRNASNIRLKVSRDGKAMVSYRAHGRSWDVLAWGAINALHPNKARKQVQFKLDRAGGWGAFGKKLRFKNACRRYDGPPLVHVVKACKAPDGSYWALQSWQRALPNYGLAASGKAAVWELRLSHWSGEVAQLTVNLNWAYKRYHHIFGTFTYLGKPVHGFKSTAAGDPLDSFGRNLYLDTFNSAYGSGWKRENSFLMHKNTGTFCYGFYSHGSRPVGAGERYRATIIGPGVTPDIYWEADALTTYDKEFDLQQHAVQKEVYGGDGLCKAV